MINNFANLSEGEVLLYQELFKPQSLKKKEYFVKSGDKNDKLAFIKKGLIRYFVLKNEEEATSKFTKEFEFIGEYQSFLGRGISIQNIEAIEDCELLTIDYNRLQRIYHETPSGNLIGRKVIEHRFNAMINQLMSIYAQSFRAV